MVDVQYTYITTRQEMQLILLLAGVGKASFCPPLYFQMSTVAVNRIICCRIIATALLIVGTLVILEYYTNNGDHLSQLIIKHQTQESLHTQRQLKESKPEEHYPQQIGTPPTDSGINGYIVIETLSMQKTSVNLLKILQCWATNNRLQLIRTPAVQEVLNTDSLQSDGQQVPSMIEALRDVDLHHMITVEVGDGDMVEEYPEILLQQTATSQEIHFNGSITINDMIADINEHIANEYQQYLIIIRNWPRITKEQLMELSHQLQCGDGQYYEDETASLQTTISHTVRNTASEYIRSMYNNDSYIAIIMTPRILQSKSFSKCLEQVTTKFHKIKANHSSMKAFIGILEDHGEDGSGLPGLIPFKMFFRSIYWMSYSIDKWKNDLTKYTKGMSKEEQLLLLEVIGSRATCMIVAGQREHYSNKIRTIASKSGLPKRSCIIEVEECN